MVTQIFSLERDMFKIFILIVSFFIVRIMAYIHATANKLPPKAKLVCDTWALVENNPERSVEKKQVNYSLTIPHS